MAGENRGSAAAAQGARRGANARPFDFLVIGANRCGTTSLWRALDSHPQIRVPSDKERSLFTSDARWEAGLERFVRTTFPGLRDDQVMGTVTPQLMSPRPNIVGTVVERVRETCPHVKLIALLRDPIDRAVSQFRRVTKVTDGADVGFDVFIARQERRRGALGKIPLVAASEYGRILATYFGAFPREQIRVFFTADLERDPGALYRSVFEFLGVDASHDPGTPRLHVGGTRRRVPPAALDELVAELDRLGLLPDDQVRRGFAWWLRHLWNVEPDDRATTIDPVLRRRLAERYVADAEVLERLLGSVPPWTGALRAAL